MILQEDNYCKVINSYTTDNWKPLLDLIPEIEGMITFGKLIKGSVSENGVHTSPYMMQQEVVARFRRVCYEIPVMINFDWGDWQEGKLILQKEGFDFDGIDIPDKCRLITYLVCLDRFSEGSLVAAFESGVVLKILKSIKYQMGLYTSLSLELRSELINFIHKQDLSLLYESYNWKMDNYKDGFPHIFKLEVFFNNSINRNCINREGILQIASWGKLPNKKRVDCPIEIQLPFVEQNNFQKFIIDEPSLLLCKLKENIFGFGPTYLSKVARFALPKYFGAIDTRIVRVFGNGDPKSKNYSWLTVKVKNQKNRFLIPESQPMWPKDFTTWTAILRYIANFLNENNIICPHPEGFIKQRLRKENKWYCADVEMALFSYATMCLDRS